MVFSNQLALSIRWPKYWRFNFSISPSSEYSELISLRIDWLDFLAVERTLESLLQHHNFESINSLVLYLLYGPALTSIHDYWKDHILDYTDLCQQGDVFAFYWYGLPFPPPMDHILSELSPMTHPSWQALHSMAHSLIELLKPLHHKAVIQ